MIGKEYGELNAERSGLLVETTTIAYREMVNVDVGLGAYAKDPWKYQPKSEEEKKAAEEARKVHSKRYWKFDKTNYSGTGEGSARHPENEKRKAQLIENRRLWDPEQNKVSTSRRSARTVADYLGSREKKASEK